MSDTLDFDELWKKYAGKTLIIPPYRGGGVDPGEPEGPGPEPQVSILSGYRYEASDAEGHRGEYYFMPPHQLKGKIRTVVVGNEGYRYSMEYRDTEIWYGRPSSGVITVTLNDCAIYKGEPVTEPSGNRIHLTFRGNTNGNRPTYFSMDGRRMTVGQKASFSVGPVRKTFVAAVRSNPSIGNGWTDGTVVKNSDPPARGIAILIPSRYAGQSFPRSDCWIEL